MTTGMCGGRPTAVGCTLDQHRALLVRHALTARSRTPTAMHAAAALITIVGFAAGLFPAGCSAQMETALAGRTLSVVGFHFPPYVTQNADGTVTGLSVDVLDELQSRAGFTYTLTIVPISGSWTKFLEAKIESGEYDLTVNWFFLTAARAKMVKFTVPYVDSGRQVFAAKPKKKKPDLLATTARPFKPFSPWLWVLSIVTIVGSSYILWLTENPESGMKLCSVTLREDFQDVESENDIHDGNVKGDTLGHSIYLGFQAFTTLHSHDPSSILGRMYMTSFTLLLVILVGTYTANLAAFILVSESSTSDVIESIEDFNAARLCVKSGSLDEKYLKRAFPRVRRFAVKTGDDMPIAIRNGDCKGGFWMSVSAELLVGQPENCDLKTVGPILDPSLGAIATRSSDTTMADTLSYHILAMRDDGRIEALNQRYIADANQCPSPTDSLSAEPQTAIEDMAGLFLVHFLVSLAVFFLILVSRGLGWSCNKANRHRHKMEKEERARRAATRKAADTDRDGTVSVKEAFVAADANNDGVISMEEFSRPGFVAPDSAWSKEGA